MNSILAYFSEHPVITAVGQSLFILLATVIVGKLVSTIERVLLRRLVGRTKTDLDDSLLDILGHATTKVIWVIGFYIALHVLDTLIPDAAMPYSDGLLYIFVVFVVAGSVSHVLQLILDWSSARWSKSSSGRIQNEFGPLFRRLISIVVYTMAIVFILKKFNQDISSVLVSLGVGSLAVALAAKDTLANMIAGFTIMTDRPFRIGDRLLLESGEKGDVYDIGLRSTKILTFDNTLIVVPNQQIINEKVTNLSYPDPQIRVTVEVGVAYGTDLDVAKLILESVCGDHPDVLEEPPPKAYFLNFGDSSLDLKVVCRVAQWDEQWRVGEEIRQGIYNAFNQEGVEIPFPQRVIYIETKTHSGESEAQSESSHNSSNQ